jgi:hypothetical protein
MNRYVIAKQDNENNILNVLDVRDTELDESGVVNDIVHEKKLKKDLTLTGELVILRVVASIDLSIGIYSKVVVKPYTGNRSKNHAKPKKK